MILFFLSTAHQDVLKEVEVEYVTMPGWNTSTTDCRTFEDLPVNAQKYVRKAEELIGIPSKYWCTFNLRLLLQYVARTFQEINYYKHKFDNIPFKSV